jgi:predicted nucleic acid-binding Zn ribbon protein
MQLLPWGPPPKHSAVPYVYRDDEGNLYDIKFPMGEAPAETFVDFGRIRVKRVFTAAPAHFKGGGWASKS